MENRVIVIPLREEASRFGRWKVGVVQQLADLSDDDGLVAAAVDYCHDPGTGLPRGGEGLPHHHSSRPVAAARGWRCAQKPGG